MPPTTPAFIGLDIGTSSVKAVLGDAEGGLLDRYEGGHEMQRGGPGLAEQDPRAWMAHVRAALAQFAGHMRAGDVVAIGVTSQVNTHVFCDAALEPLAPAITWQDTRAAEVAAGLDARLTEVEKVAALGAPIPIDASHALARMGWMAQTHPEVWQATAHVLLPKDYVIAQLTGAVAGDPISAVGLVGTDMRYAGAVLGLVDRAETVLPALCDPLDIVGEMRAGGPFTGVPVAMGTMDAWAGMFGLGVADEGTAMYLSGTSDVLGLISANRTGAQGIITFPDWRGITLHAGPTQSGGASLAWVARLLGRDVAALGGLAVEAPINLESPLFLPHLEGERAPLWDAASRGSFANLSSATGPEALVAAVMEGVAFSGRLALEAIEQSGAQRVQTLRHGGGGAVSDSWCQIRANALGKRLERVAVADVGAMGALVMAASAVGTLGDLGAAARGLVSVDGVFEPDPAVAALSQERFAAYKALYAGLEPVGAALRGV